MPYLQVKDVEMFYEKMGVGETVIFLHSGYSRGILAAVQNPDRVATLTTIGTGGLCDPTGVVQHCLSRGNMTLLPDNKA